MKTTLLKIRNLSVLFALVALLLLPGVGWGQILTFEFAALAGGEASAVSNSNDANLTSSTITRGSGLTASANGGRFNATSWAITSIANAVSGSDYMEFTITPNSGFQFSVSSIVVQWQRSATGNTAISLRSSVDSYATDLDAIKSVTDNTSTQTFTWTFTQANSSAPVTYRLYSYAEATGGSGGPGDGTGNDIVVNGTTSAAGGNIPPAITNIQQTPATGIISTTTVSVSADVTDSDGTVEGVELHWGTSSGSLGNTIDMSLDAGSTYTTDSDIPAQTGGTTVYYEVYAIDDDADETTSTERNYYVASSEPTNHVTSLSATSPNSSTITLTWDDNDGAQAASGFLILANKTGTFTDPVDGTPQADDEALVDGTGIKNIASGVETYSWINLDASTQYFFRIYPYTNSGSVIDYKTDGSVPEDETTTQSPAIVSYTWIGADNGSWAVSTNWSPTRTTPANTDVLMFNDGTTKTVTSVPAQTIGQLFVTDNTIITLQAAGSNTLTIAGGTGSDFEIESGSGLSITGANALVISLGASASGSVNGSMTLAGAAHKLISLAASGITFNTGSVFTAGTALSGNPFGTTSLNSILFAGGSTYVALAGSNPFGAGAPNSVVVFQTGSLYKLAGNISPALSGRTYADVEMDVVSYSASVSGGSAGSIDNLTVTNGTLNFNMTGSPGHSIKGNIAVQPGATLNFNPSAAGTVNLNGTAQQTISGGGNISSNTNSTLVINNATGIVLNNNATLTGNLTISAGSLDINPGRQLTVSGTLTNTPGASGLVIKSNSTSTGSLIHSTAGVSANVERYIAAAEWSTGTDGWHLLSSPVAAQSISGDWTPSGTGNDYDMYIFDETKINEYWLNQKVPANNITTFETGKGYLVAYEQAATKLFSGTLNTGDVDLNGLTNSGTGSAYPGWHLLGNPFASSIKFNQGAWDKTNIGAYAQVWNESTASYKVLAGNQIIPSQNGFMVYTTGSGELTIPADARLHGDSTWYKSTEPGNEIVLIAHDLENQTAQESVICFDPMATEGFDLAYDSYFMAGFAPMFYSFSGNDLFALNTLPEVTNSLSIPFGFVKNNASAYKIELEKSITGATVYLTDNKLNITTNLSETPAYLFNASEGDMINRFIVHFGSVGIDDLNSSSDLRVYVNNGNIYVSLQQNNEAVVKVYSLTGQLVLQESARGKSLTAINANTLPNGVYIVSLVSGEQVVSRKVVLRN
ncbi:MAG: T9SS type A sorting domain-containing protein [Bacteroidota bacterium]